MCVGVCGSLQLKEKRTWLSTFAKRKNGRRASETRNGQREKLKEQQREKGKEVKGREEGERGRIGQCKKDKFKENHHC